MHTNQPGTISRRCTGGNTGESVRRTHPRSGVGAAQYSRADTGGNRRRMRDIDDSGILPRTTNAHPGGTRALPVASIRATGSGTVPIIRGSRPAGVNHRDHRLDLRQPDVRRVRRPLRACNIFCCRPAPEITHTA